MQISISNIPEEGLDLRFSKGGEWFHQYVPMEDGCDFSIDKIDVRCQVKKVLENVSIKGTVEAKGMIGCSRCLEWFDFPVESDFSYVFTPAEDYKDEDEIELTCEDLDYDHYEGDLLDLGALIVEQIVLQVPIKPLCNDSCKGLCPTCGANLNREKCDHETQQGRSPFAALKNFKFNKEG